MSEVTASGIDEVDELSSLPHLKPGKLYCPFVLAVAKQRKQLKCVLETRPLLSGCCTHNQQGTHTWPWRCIREG